MTEEKRREIRDIARNAYVAGYETGWKAGVKEAKRFILAISVWAVVIAIGVAVVGCAPQPFVEYEHLSQPNIDDDGYDLACLGAAQDYGRVEVSGAACENFAGRGTDTFAKINVRVNLGESK